MKETRNASLASQSFLFEEDAYAALKHYLEDIASRLPEGDRETMEDIEYRLAEIFREKLTSPMMVLTLKQVNEAKSQMGRPADFGEVRSEEQSAERPTEGSVKRLYRSCKNRSIAGVCAGLAEYLGLDPTLMRLLTLFLLLFGGLSIWVYIVLWIIIPEEPMRPLHGNQQTNR